MVVHRDQVLAQLKTVAFDKPMNWTLNIPFIHTSPDHGTAYGGAGRGAANPSSMVAVIRLYRLLACGADQERLFCD